MVFVARVSTLCFNAVTVKTCYPKRFQGSYDVTIDKQAFLNCQKGNSCTMLPSPPFLNCYLLHLQPKLFLVSLNLVAHCNVQTGRYTDVHTGLSRKVPVPP